MIKVEYQNMKVKHNNFTMTDEVDQQTTFTYSKLIYLIYNPCEIYTVDQ